MSDKPKKFGNAVVPLLTFLLCTADAGITYYMLTYFPQGWFCEKNPVGRYLIERFGIRDMLLIMYPLFVGGVCILAHTLWYSRIIRFFTYLVLLSRIGVVCWNFYLLHLVIQQLIASHV